MEIKEGRKAYNYNPFLLFKLRYSQVLNAAESFQWLRCTGLAVLAPLFPAPHVMQLLACGSESLHRKGSGVFSERMKGAFELIVIQATLKCIKLARCPSEPIRGTWEVIHQPGRLHLDTKAFFSNILSNFIPRSRVLHQRVSRRDDAVVDFRVGRVPCVALEFFMGIASRQSRPPQGGESRSGDKVLRLQMREFFGSGVWKALPLSSLGIGKLRGRLSKVLLGQIAAELPGLMHEIDQKFKYCRDQLVRLGDPRASSQEQQRLYLFHLNGSFQALVKASVSGSYNDSFFLDAKTESGYQRRIRAVVQNLNEDFA
ncbi:hypothetical protein B0T21DRAFT_352572 [Apiosordaria backusii]|uniref:Dynamin stalk domain-containing protein n=1 Tax=Apiosordaria backusii TaxID=314023 RepID=A0AA40DNM1_9PEZI|nr:hypothetical protein B0T21DRAFT_352572 [Apiosordaria backusii]